MTWIRTACLQQLSSRGRITAARRIPVTIGSPAMGIVMIESRQVQRLTTPMIRGMDPPNSNTMMTTHGMRLHLVATAATIAQARPPGVECQCPCICHLQAMAAVVAGSGAPAVGIDEVLPTTTGGDQAVIASVGQEHGHIRPRPLRAKKTLCITQRSGVQSTVPFRLRTFLGI